MAFLILLIISGAVFAYFAAQNTQQISINFLHYTTGNLPLYLVILIALLLGITISWVISFFGFVSTSLTIFGKNSKIKEDKKEIDSLKKKIHDLELENERLKGEVSAKQKE